MILAIARMAQWLSALDFYLVAIKRFGVRVSMWASIFPKFFGEPNAEESQGSRPTPPLQPSHYWLPYL